MNTRTRGALRVVVVVSLSLAAPVGAAHLQSIAAARTAAIGGSVTVRGTVTVPSGAFDTGFAIQQGSAGIYVLDAGTEPRAKGDSVTVTGTLVDSSGLLAIQPAAISCERKAWPIVPRAAATGDVGEATEGRLLRLEGTISGELVDDSPYGYKLMLDDGSGPIQIFLYPGANISISGLHAGVRLSVDCFSNQYETHYECDPPDAASVRLTHEARNL